MITKCCTKCLSEYPATLEYFYKNKGGKYGLTPRCKKCVNLDNAANHAKRLITEPDQVRSQANTRAKKSYHKNINDNRERQRNHQATRRADPEKRKIIYARKRAGGAGLTPEEINIILTNQDNKCKICGCPNPTDLDHCHDTKRIRWLLCNHCNRGLGAFKDNPELLRKAAQLLEEFNWNDKSIQALLSPEPPSQA